MGGPMILRGAAKAAAGAPCRGLGAIGIVPNPPRRISGVLGSNQNGVVQAASVEVLHEQQGLSSREWEYEGWELTGDEERVEYAVRDHVVFGAPPSKEEAETATADLRIALSSHMQPWTALSGLAIVFKPGVFYSGLCLQICFGKGLERCCYTNAQIPVSTQAGCENAEEPAKVAKVKVVQAPAKKAKVSKRESVKESPAKRAKKSFKNAALPPAVLTAPAHVFAKFRGLPPLRMFLPPLR